MSKRANIAKKTEKERRVSKGSQGTADIADNEDKEDHQMRLVSSGVIRAQVRHVHTANPAGRAPPASPWRRDHQQPH